MAKHTHKLTDVKVRNIKSKGFYNDGDGLYLKVTDTLTKSWIFRFKFGVKENGKAKSYDKGLGTYPLISLGTARDKAHECRKALADGRNPMEEKKSRAAAQPAPVAKGVFTFDLAAQEYIELQEGGWKNAKHRQQWRNTLAQYVSPVIGAMDVADIDTSHILQIITPLWRGDERRKLRAKQETGSRVRQRIESILDYATVLKKRQGQNPAQWLNHLERILPERKKKLTVRHHPAMAWKDVPEFMTLLRANSSISARALEFTILNAVRTSEAIEATWKEIDLDAALWIIPKERMKAGVEFRVPLTDAAIALLKSLPRMEGCPYLFPGARKGQPLSNMAMLQLLRGMHPGLTVHGFRSSFRDWAGDSQPFPFKVVEMCLAHTVDSDVEAAYRRSDMIAKRRKVMDAWANFCGKGKAKGTVVPMFNRA